MKRAKKLKRKLVTRQRDYDDTVGKGTNKAAYRRPGSNK